MIADTLHYKYMVVDCREDNSLLLTWLFFFFAGNSKKDFEVHQGNIILQNGKLISILTLASGQFSTCVGLVTQPTFCAVTSFVLTPDPPFFDDFSSFLRNFI